MPGRPRGFAAFARLLRGDHGQRVALAPADATPLANLPLIALDIETTGLDPQLDRMLSLAALPLRGPHPDGEDLEFLVQPGVPIPPASTAVHGIDDAAVAAAPPYPAHHAAVVERLHGRVALGHTIGFDLAVIAAEARRHRLHLPATASLCLAELAAAVLPENTAVDLDQLAHRFDVAIEGRHTARGDAVAAAAIWVRLLPHLLDRGIHTFGDARRVTAEIRALLSLKRRSRF
ncbi:3'-5' exonuclease [Desertibaculum subflavum]|uniref:3'-5' exonuclease n=1 Tax=Desertibaculum subflavum TaxID=2268458 RepID=UPI000E6699E8